MNNNVIDYQKYINQVIPQLEELYDDHIVFTYIKENGISFESKYFNSNYFVTNTGSVYQQKNYQNWVEHETKLLPFTG